jgi:hypothetical protein
MLLVAGHWVPLDEIKFFMYYLLLVPEFLVADHGVLLDEIKFLVADHGVLLDEIKSFITDLGVLLNKNKFLIYYSSY